MLLDAMGELAAKPHTVLYKDQRKDNPAAAGEIEI